MARSVANTTSSNRRRLLLLAAAAAVALTILAPPVVAAPRRSVRLRVYVQEFLGEPGQTEKLLLTGPGPENPNLWPPFNVFGNTMVMDDHVTVGPGNDTATVGRVYGTYTTASMTGRVYTVSFTLLLTAGRFNGSTLVIGGIDDEDTMEVREHAVLGGTGALRGADGYVLAKVTPVTSRYVVMKLDVYATVPIRTNQAIDKAAADDQLMIEDM